MKNSTSHSRPSHAVYVVEGEGQDAYWTRIGSAWAHSDGDGFNIQLSALPMNGRLTVRKPKAQTTEPEGR